MAKTCPECGSTKIKITREDGALCNQCGLVFNNENYFAGRQIV